MARTALIVLTLLAPILPEIAWAAENGPAGNWKLTVFTEGQHITIRIMKLESKEGKWSGAIAASDLKRGSSPLENLQITEDAIRFTFKHQGQDLSFEGKMPATKENKILGSIVMGRQMILAWLERTTLQSLDRFDVAKEIMNGSSDQPEYFEAARDVLNQAKDKKAKPDEVRGWAEKAFKAAGAFGVRWQREIGARMTQTLAQQEPFVAIAVEYGRRTERLLDPKDDADTQIRVLEALSLALHKAGKAEETKEIDARIDKLEAKADLEYLKRMSPFQPDTFKGRKGKSDRVVLVELFTGAQCPPCVAADLAFDGVEKTYKPSDVILLEYHEHIPGPDPLTNPDAEARLRYYGDDIEGTPTILFDGKPKAGGGGGVGNAKDKYGDYRDAIEAQLEKPPKAKLKATATRKGDKIDIQAEVSDLEKPGEKVRLRLALVEDQVRYLGGNQVRLHHRVVRALPGGAAGLALKEKTGKQTASVDLEELRKKLNKYLDDFGKRSPFPDSKRPMDLKKLSVVAFVQDDDSKEILQATQAEVPSGEGEAATR
jgi:thiol-disulfide isomerase/thioredoxin